MDAISTSADNKIPLHKKLLLFIFVLLIFGACSGFISYRMLRTPPVDFPVGNNIVIEEGLTINEITERLAQQRVVRSPIFLYIILLYRYKDVYVQAGEYTFDTPLSVDAVAQAITAGTYRAPLISITLPEGFRARDIVSYLPSEFTIPSPDQFVSYEGYLFPDTYFISTRTTPEEFLTLLTDTCAERLIPYEARIAQLGFSEQEVLILASIIEREAKDVQSKKIVSGILQNRLDTDMPLQVDASFDYILDKTSNELTMDDLSIDSPYNTYKHTGLPPTPIANPGIESIEAVLYPEESEYLYYLTAPDGTFYYAKTFDEHKVNKARYLR